jgi:hypothetical protein
MFEIAESAFSTGCGLVMRSVQIIPDRIIIVPNRRR